LDLKKKVLWCYFPEVWRIFYEEYDMNYDQVQQLMKNVVLKPLNGEGFTPRPYYFWILSGVETTQLK
jgi:hypothetical protein